MTEVTKRLEFVIRVMIIALHLTAELEQGSEAFQQVGKEPGVIRAMVQ